MDTISKAVLIVHTLIALGIISLVLLQRGKGADAGAGFGAGASGTVFGARGSGSFFSRATAVLATAFFISSLALAYLSSQHPEGPESILEGAPIEQETASEAPAAAEEQLPAVEPTMDATEAPAATPTMEDELPSLDDDGASSDTQQ